MQKSIILVIMLSLLMLTASCSTAPVKPPEKNNTSKNTPIVQQQVKPSALVGQHQDTASQPASIKNLRLAEKNGYLAIDAEFENNAAKAVETIMFSVLLFDNSGHPVNKYNDANYGNIEEGLLLQRTIASGATDSGAWRAYNYKSAGKAKVIIQEVHFSDKTAWINQKYNSQLEKEKL